MAELAFGVAGEVIKKLGSVAWQELGLAWGVKSDLRKLERTMPIIREVLLVAEKRQASDPLLRLWLGRLNDVLHDADDVLDEIEYQALRKQVVATTYGSTSTKVRHFFSSSTTHAIFPFKLAHKIKDIRERLDEIEADKNKFNLTQIREDGNIIHQPREIDLISYVDPSDVIGRDEDKENIINFLMPRVPSKNVSVISIVGFGGLGKTTLAKSVYNHKSVVDLFQLRMWVCVSEDFSITRLIKEILKSACSTIVDNWNVDTLQSKLREHLRDKKFLLVLDDVWNEDHNKWIELRGLLIDGSEGSKIIVTTRSNRVASIMSTVSTYNLKGLSQDQCLSLFVKRAFKEGEIQNPNLLEIGKEIVRKCKGVPLAVRTLGSMLHSKVDEQEWESVRDNEIWKSKQNENDMLVALQLSYDHMPNHLKRCFAFCSLFPKDYKFRSLYLIQMWMAHGLIVEKEKQELEDVGDSYINELLSRSFFQDVDRRYPTSPHYSFKMHDLIHDLAISVARGECSAVDSGDKDTIAGTVRHLSFSPINLYEVPKCLDKLKKVRTIMSTETMQPLLAPFVIAYISRFKYLRLLDLSDSSFKVLPSSVGVLKHLRYLNLSFNKRIKKLPNSICKLHNLQTLMLFACRELEQLPKDIRNMINLRNFSVTTKYTCLFENGSFNSLRFLLVHDCSRLEVLFQGMDGCLPNLRTLSIRNCKRLTSFLGNIKHLTALKHLIIKDCIQLDLIGENNQDLKLSLQTLSIIGLSQLKVLPQWLQQSANTLQYLRIRDCEEFTTLPEWLPTLKSLYTLEIIRCPELSSLPEETRLTALRSLKIKYCPELSRKCKEEDKLKIAHVPDVKLDDEDVLSNWF